MTLEGEIALQKRFQSYCDKHPEHNKSSQAIHNIFADTLFSVAGFNSSKTSRIAGQKFDRNCENEIIIMVFLSVSSVEFKSQFKHSSSLANPRVTIKQ